ncbi:MAG: PEP-CTERM sorting domain-containing protein [Planctomycetota bacterium]
MTVPAVMGAAASGQLLFEEFLVSGTDDSRHFFEFTATDASFLAPGSGAALLVIDGDEGNAGTITNLLDLQIDFTREDQTFPVNNLFFSQPVVISGAQTSPTLPGNIIDYQPDPVPSTYFTGGGDFFFGSDSVASASATYVLVGGFSGEVGQDLDTDNDGTFDVSLPFTSVYDAITILNSANNLGSLASGTETTPRFTGKNYADDLTLFDAPTESAAFPLGQFPSFDQRFDETIGISPDGPDGFFRFTDGTPAIFDVNVNNDGLDGIPGTADDAIDFPDGPNPNAVFEFDGSVAFGDPDEREEIAYINAAGQTVEALIRSDSDPDTPGDQFTAYLTPGSANNIVRPAEDGPVLPDPVPSGLEEVTDFVRFGEDKIGKAAIPGVFIAGTSFENEAAGTYNFLDEEADGIDYNDDGDTTDQFIGFSELFNGGVDVTGNSDDTDVAFIAYRDQRTNSEGNSEEPQPLGDEGSASGQRVALVNDPNALTGTTFNGVLIDNRIQYPGPDGIDDTDDDVFFDSPVAGLNSTEASELAGDLGYQSTFIDTRSRFEEGSGDPTGDIWGLIDFDNFDLDPTPGGVADGRDGQNAFFAEDVEGELELAFDPVDLSNYVDVTFHALIGANDTGYEAEDLIRFEMVLTTDAGTTVEEILFFEGASGLEGIGILGELVDANGELGEFTYEIADDVTEAQFIATFGSSSGAEEFLLDDIAFFGTLIDAVNGIVGDYDDSGQVEQGDLNFVLNNWGLEAPFDPNGDPFVTSIVDQEELNRVLNNWGDTNATPDFSGFTNVPEPATAALALAGLGLLAKRRRTA